MPPLADPVNVTCWFVWGEEGLKMKLALKGGGVVDVFTVTLTDRVRLPLVPLTTTV